MNEWMDGRIMDAISTRCTMYARTVHLETVTEVTVRTVTQKRNLSFDEVTPTLVLMKLP